MTFHNRRNNPRPSDNDKEMMTSVSVCGDVTDDDKSSLEAAAEAAAKVNAMLIAKGMLKPNQLHTGLQNVVTKKVGGPNSLVVAEVEINYLPLPCRNTLTRGGTQEEISKASGASVTTRGRYMTEEEKARNPRDRCLYLNIQAARKESVDVAVQKIDEIIKTMGGDKLKKKGPGGPGFHGGPRFHPPQRPPFHNHNPRFEGGGAKNQPPRPLMSLPGPQQMPQQPPPQMQPMMPQPQIHMQPPPPTTVQVTVMQEKLYVGLEHAPPNFDTKNKLLGPGGSFLQHIQNETGTSVSLRGKGSGFIDMNGVDTFEPMHIFLEHSSLMPLQEAKKLAENLIQTVQQSYVSFQQALAALPPSVPTGHITGLPQQPPMVEHHQLTVAQSTGLATIPTVQEQSLQALQPQALANTAAGQAVVIQPTSMTLQVPMVTPLPISAAPAVIQQPAPLEMVGQQQVIINHPQGPPPQAIVQQVVQAPPPGQPQPQPVPPPGSAFAPMQQAVQLVSQAPPLSIMQQQSAPAAIIAQPPPQVFTPQPQPSASVAPPSSIVYTVASSSGHAYYSSIHKDGEEKRRFREEKDDKIPENLLGYQHGPPHLVNLVRSSPPPQPVPPPPMSQAHLIPQQAQYQHQPGVVMSHLPPPFGMEQPPPHQQPPPPHQQHPPPAFLQPGQPPQMMEGQMPPHSLPPPQFQPPLSQHQPHQFVSMSGPPPMHIHQFPPPMSSPTRMTSVSPSCIVTSSPNGEVRSPGRDDKSLMPPPPPPSGLRSPTEDGNNKDSNKFDDNKESPGKRKSNGYNNHEPEKKKIKGILKNKQDQGKQEAGEKENRDNKEDIDERQYENNGDDDNVQHPASPQYQGQPLRYPSMPSDPNIPPHLQEMGIQQPQQQQPRMPLPHTVMHQPPNHPPNMIPSHHPHHLVQASDPNLPPHVQHPQPPPQHIHIEQGLLGPRPEGPPGHPQIMIEHPIPPGTPIHITHPHHRPPPPVGPPQTSMPLEQHPHAINAGPPPPRQILIEHPHPPPTPLDQHMPPTQQPPPQLQHSEHLPPPPQQPPLGSIPQPMPAPPPQSHQEVIEYEVLQNRGPPPPGQHQFQTFEPITVSGLSQPEPQPTIIQGGPPPPPSVMAISSAQHFIPMSSAPPPQVSFAIASSQTPGPIPVYSQPLQHPPPQQQQGPPPQQPQAPPPPQMIAGPPPPGPPQPSFSMGVPPSSSSHFQAQFSHPVQAIQQGLPPQPIASQPQFHQQQPQGVHYWAS